VQTCALPIFPVRGDRQVIEQVIAPGVRGDISSQDVAGDEIALEQPGIAWEVFGVGRAWGSRGPGGEPQKRACGIDVDADYAEELRVGAEIRCGPVRRK